jgi:glycosyltransferase involved in cell wall biosynthesis/putative flippase GtrA
MTVKHGLLVRNDRAPERRDGPLHVLWLADKLGYGDRLHDVGLCYASVLPALREVEVIPAVLRSTNGVASQLQARGIPVRQLRHGRFDPRTLWTLIRLIRRERIDVLHLHGYGASAFGRVAAWLTRTPAILHQYDSFSQAPWYGRLSDRLLSRMTSWAIAASQSAKEFCMEERAIPGQQILVWHNGVSADTPAVDGRQRAAVRERLGIPADRLVVGTMTRLTADKGVRCLVEAAGRLLAMRPNTMVLIIGDGPERRRLEAAAARLGLGERVRFFEFRADARELLPAFDCFVLPSITEGSSFSLLEAMGMGLPIIATAVGGTLDILSHGETGWLVPARDPRALADGMITLLDDSALRTRLAANARIASRAYDVRQYAQRLAALYQQAVATRRQRSMSPRRAWLKRFRTLVRYSIVGASGGAIHFSLLWSLVELVNVPVLIATTIGFVAAVVNNFFWNRLWTFESTERNVRLQFTRFAFVSICGLTWNTLGMAALVSWLRLPYLLGQAVTTAFVWWWNFLANTYWTFQPLRFKVPQWAEGACRYELSIVVPAYNEERRLSRTINALASYVRSRKLRAELILVDDGSRDRTLTVATQMPVEGVQVRVIHNATNGGKGAAVRDGFQVAEGAYILMTDADNSIPIECLDALWPKRDARCVLIGSRYLHGRRRQPDVPWLRYWIGRIGNWLIRGFLLPDIHDTQCGFKLFSLPAAQALAARQRITGFGFDMELLAIARALGIEIREVGIRWSPIPGSRVRPIRDAWRVLGELGMIKAFLWCGFYHTERPFEASSAARGA